MFAAHLPGCARCAETVAETREVMAAMATDLPSAEPSEELRHRLRAAVADTEQVHRPVTPVPSPAADPAGGRPDGADDAGPSAGRVPARSSRPGAVSCPPRWWPPPSRRSWVWASGRSS